MGLKIYCDGGARGNPGPAAAAFVVYEVNDGDPSTPPRQARGRSGLPAVKLQVKCGKYLGVATNNEAEYQAVIEALGYVLSIKYKVLSINFFLDSNLVVNQLNGVFKIKVARLRELLMKVRELEAQVGLPISYSYVPRERNFEADLLVNQTLDRQIVTRG